MKAIVFCLLLILLNSVLGQPVIPVGNVEAVSIERNGLQIKTQNAFALIAPYTPNIIRIKIDREAFKKDFSYAVIAKPETVRQSVSQTSDSIVLSTDSLKCVIQKIPFSARAAV